MTVSSALSGIGEYKGVLRTTLGQKGFSDVRSNDMEVAGGKNGCWVSIGHFHITDWTYWEIVMCGGDSPEITNATVNEVVTIIKNLRFL
ncbi:hypothetical protein [Bacillus thuringiensis]|uniref:hypothetical protein n=1 Tax=Bacillus thuringiensis TaxID=1428 RepID=UPI00115EB262|nr:hypothetical protein [Bacillus thuringiensis]HDX9637549.1 hypothetical protein [Bacillus cereus]